jgi:leucyl-tRNA---protein transferase
MSSQHISLYLTAEHACGYLPDRLAANLVPDPAISMTMPLYSQLIELGYRRSGQHTYRPHCRLCDACIPCRIPVHRFEPRRNQRRAAQINSDCTIHLTEAGFNEERFALYSRYLNARHHDGGMANPQPVDFINFLYCDWSDTLFLEVRRQDQLIAVAVFDRVLYGLSAVYSFFDPRERGRSLGTYCVLQLINQAQQMKLSHVYLGYLILESRKMAYKADYRPLEIFRDNRWRLFDDNAWSHPDASSATA